MSARAGGREAGLQMLFALDGGASDLEGILRHFWREFPADPEARPYAEELVRGVTSLRDKLDDLVRQASTNWRVERMTRVDRNVLRLATWELVHRADIPTAVILDEAVALAKRYGNEQSGAFVNGVLDSVARESGRLPDSTVPEADS